MLRNTSFCYFNTNQSFPNTHEKTTDFRNGCRVLADSLRRSTENYCQGRKILNQWRSVDVCRAFETFDEFIKYRNGNLKNCDLSGAIDLDVDFSKYTTDDTTKLPIREDENLSCKVLKVYKNGEFAVCQFWSNEDKEIVKQQVHRFSYFFDLKF